MAAVVLLAVSAEAEEPPLYGLRVELHDLPRGIEPPALRASAGGYLHVGAENRGVEQHSLVLCARATDGRCAEMARMAPIGPGERGGLQTAEVLQAGSYELRCGIHGAEGMVARLEVTGPTRASPLPVLAVALALLLCAWSRTR